jgi:hypothetical protein
MEEETKNSNTPENKNEIVKIFKFNNDQVMFEYDVADFFKVSVQEVLDVVKKNSNRFPDDFLLNLTQREYNILCQEFSNSNLTKQNYIPLGFTDSGLAMLSCFLNTNEAIDYNVSVIRMFSDLSRTSSDVLAIEQRINSIEVQMAHQFDAMNQALDGLCQSNNLNRNPIGFKSKKDL